METKQVLILGAGGHGREVADILRSSLSDSITIGFIDDQADNLPADINGFPVLGKFDDIESFERESTKVISAVGKAAVQRKFVGIATELGYRFQNAIHPRATISKSAVIGVGVVVFEYASLHCNTQLGNHSCLNVGASVSHDSLIGDFSSINPGARIAGGAKIGNDCYIGMEASIIQGIQIEDRVTIGAGAVIIRNISAGSKVVGVPGRTL